MFIYREFDNLMPPYTLCGQIANFLFCGEPSIRSADSPGPRSISEAAYDFRLDTIRNGRVLVLPGWFVEYQIPGTKPPGVLGHYETATTRTAAIQACIDNHDWVHHDPDEVFFRATKWAAWQRYSETYECFEVVMEPIDNLPSMIA